MMADDAELGENQIEMCCDVCLREWIWFLSQPESMHCPGDRGHDAPEPPAAA